MNKKDLQALREAAKAGATWKDLAAIIGVSDRTLRRWRDDIEEEEEYPEDYFDGVEVEDRRPPPDDAAQILAAIHAGRAEGRQELIDLIRQQAVEKKDLRTLLALLKRMDGMDK
ncbi:MAG: transposase [Caldilineaceae bacterium]|nr:transposase [Caldilineaceae bacterium]MDE0462724.1 transposase [Caldilineaceae bacterium]